MSTISNDKDLFLLSVTDDNGSLSNADEDLFSLLDDDNKGKDQTNGQSG